MNYYNEIKNTLIDVEVYKKVKDYSKNRYELEKYYQVGKLLIEAQGGVTRAKYGNGLIKEYSKKLVNDIDKKYSVRLLYKMIKYYKYVTAVKLPTVSAKLSWSHFDELLSIDDMNKINYYIMVTAKQNLSVRALRDKIRSNEYERLDDNTKLKLITKEEITISDNIKNPIIIKNKYDTEKISEKMLKRLILEDLPNFMKELGPGYCFIDSEYKILIGNNFNYIDLLLFNIEYNCYAVVELKVTELAKEHIGQIEIYMNYIDKNIKKVTHNKTIGIIVTRKDNKYIILYRSNPKIYNTIYELI